MQCFEFAVLRLWLATEMQRRDPALRLDDHALEALLDAHGIDDMAVLAGMDESARRRVVEDCLPSRSLAA